MLASKSMKLTVSSRPAQSTNKQFSVKKKNTKTEALTNLVREHLVEIEMGIWLANRLKYRLSQLIL